MGAISGGESASGSGGGGSDGGGGSGGGAGAGDAGTSAGSGGAGTAGTGGDIQTGGVSGASAGSGGGGATSGTGGAAGEPSCRSDMYGGKEYVICPHAGLARDAAQKACQQRGGDLVVLDNELEEQWVFGVLTEPGSIWIGANDIAAEDDWRWPDGSAISAGYAGWAEGQPNDSGAGEDCAVLHSGMGRWNDVACDVTTFGADPLSFVCEP
jgi:hypothetical protein